MTWIEARAARRIDERIDELMPIVEHDFVPTLTCQRLSADCEVPSLRRGQSSVPLRRR